MVGNLFKGFHLPSVTRKPPTRGCTGPRTQKQLRALKRNSVPPGGVLNPFGMEGFARRKNAKDSWFETAPALREKAMKRKRVQLEVKKAIALEAHELQQLARENASLAMQTLIEISSNNRAPEATRIAASVSILDRAYGKASQTSITANVSNGKTKDLDGAELDKRINDTLKRVEAVTNRTPKAGTSKERPADLRKLN
jgi:hypothetical protein